MPKVDRAHPARCPSAEPTSKHGIETCYDCAWMYECYYFGWDKDVTQTAGGSSGGLKENCVTER
jgi:hypothetical protein